jgi:hypothetical protein
LSRLRLPVPPARHSAVLALFHFSITKLKGVIA